MKRQRVFFQVGLYASLITAVLHTIGSMQHLPPPANDTEATLFKLLTTYAVDLAGSRLTFDELINGFSYTFTLLLVWVAAVGFVALRSGGMLLTSVARLNALGFAVLLVISILHFPLPPTICTVVLVFAFLGASFGGH